MNSRAGELRYRRWLPDKTTDYRTIHRKFMIVDKLMETVLLTINLDGGSMLVSQPIWTVNTTMVATMANLSVMVFIGANGLRFVMRYVQRKGILDISPTGGLDIVRTPRTIWNDYYPRKAYSINWFNFVEIQPHVISIRRYENSTSRFFDNDWFWESRQCQSSRRCKKLKTQINIPQTDLM